MNKVLVVASVAGFLVFERRDIQLLQSLGYEVDCCTNFSEYSSSIDDLNVHKIHIPFKRNPLNKNNIKAYRKLNKIINEGNYSLIHCHTPIGGVLTRLASRKLRKQGKLKVIYTAHGFHFFKGAPLKNWILFYPIEKWLSRYTDVLITINKEDYKLANERFHADIVYYIPSVGIRTEKFQLENFQRDMEREQMGIGKDDFLLLSIGELAGRKNHEIVIKALCKIKNEKIFYFIAGEGTLRERYQQLIDDNNLSKNVKLLGLRDDIPELCNMADAIVHPSKREGFGIAAIEGMAAGLPLICSYVNGIKDYAKHMENSICCRNNNLGDFINAINTLYRDKELRIRLGKNAQEKAKKYDLIVVKEIMNEIYLDLL